MIKYNTVRTGKQVRKMNGGISRVKLLVITFLTAALLLVLSCASVSGYAGEKAAEAADTGAVADENAVPENAAEPETATEPETDVQETGSDETVTELLSEAAEAVDMADDAEDGHGIVVFADDSGLRGLKGIVINVKDTSARLCKWRFPYSDDFFRRPSNEFSLRMAQSSVGLASSTYRADEEGYELQYDVFLSKAGFKNIKAFGYDEPTTQDSLSGVIGSKKVSGVTVIAAAPCGIGYGKEWAGNLMVGDETRHVGFNQGAALFEEKIREYIKEQGIEGPMKLWLAGHSRAAAISNIAAADFIDSGLFEDVYMYGIGVPRTTKEPGQYSGIYNIINTLDPIAEIPLKKWGYSRYGIDFYTPAEETDSNYHTLRKKASIVRKNIVNDKMRNNPEVNYQFSIIFDYLGEMYPASKDYADGLQQALIDNWGSPRLEGILDVVSRTIEQMDAGDIRNRYNARVLLNYLSLIMSQHTTPRQRQVADDSWNPSEDNTTNAAREHVSSTYISWLFSGNNVNDLLLGSTKTRCVVVEGDAGITIKKDGSVIKTLSENGDYEVKKRWRVFILHSGGRTTMFFPDDRNYELLIDKSESGQLTYHDNITDRTGETAPGRLYKGNVQPGSYSLKIIHDEPLGQLIDTSDGSVLDLRFRTQEFSSASVMRDECNAAGMSYLSISDILKLVGATFTFLMILSVICLISTFVHFKKLRRSFNVTFSDAFVIVPHMLIIYMLTGISMIMSYYLFTVSNIRSELAAFTIFAIFLMSLQALIRRPGYYNLILTLMLLIVMDLTRRYYSSSFLYDYSTENMFLSFFIVTLLSILVIRGFPRSPRRSGEQTGADCHS